MCRKLNGLLKKRSKKEREREKETSFVEHIEKKFSTVYESRSFSTVSIKTGHLPLS